MSLVCRMVNVFVIASSRFLAFQSVLWLDWPSLLNGRYLGNRNVADIRKRQLEPPVGPATVGPAATARFTGCLPSSVTLLTLKSNGTFHTSLACQLAEASILTPIARPFPRL